MRVARRTLLLAALFVGCNEPVGPVPPHALVAFTIDAPLCSSRIPVTFTVDGLTVGADTFFVHLAPEHVTSRSFEVAPGVHMLGARTAFGYVWADRTVTLRAGTTFVDTLPFYCS